MMASDGNACVIGSSDRKKHEKKLLDSRASTKTYRTGNVNGDPVPTDWRLKGIKKRRIFSEIFILKNGSGAGSTICMTKTAFMTEEAWLKIAPNIISGLRSTNELFRANPQWWMLELFDGFGPHASSLHDMKLRCDAKISCVKEEGYSSHVNKAYD